MTDDQRDQYVREFTRLAEIELADLLTRYGGRLERFGVDGDDTVHAEAVVSFRGHRFRYRRLIWPPDHPLPLKVSLYVTFLQERLLTRPAPPHTDPDELIPL
jgi:hypothetical protein